MKLLPPIAFLVTIIVNVSPVSAQNANEKTHWWAENAGWINTDSLELDGAILAGFIWSENLGWINLGNGPADDEHYANEDGSDFGVNLDDDGFLDGYAWAENIGWINFDTALLDEDRARYDFEAQRFAGFAWGENIGWINLNPEVTEAPENDNENLNENENLNDNVSEEADDEPGVVWSENLGWINARLDAADGLSVEDTYLSGRIWAVNSGWINLGNGPAGGEHYANEDGSDFGVNIDDDGSLSGYAWGENIGWIGFDTSALLEDAAHYDAQTQTFSGYVWAENAGWVNLDGLSLSAAEDVAEEPDDLQTVLDYLGLGEACGAGGAGLIGLTGLTLLLFSTGRPKRRRSSARSRRSLMCMLLCLASVLVLAFSGCGGEPTPEDDQEQAEQFTPGTGDTFGTLSTPQGTFDLQQKDGRVTQIEASGTEDDDGNIRFPDAEDPTLTITSDGGSLAISSGADNAVVLTIDDNDFGEETITLGGDAADTLLGILDPSTKTARSMHQEAECDKTIEFLDALCRLTNRLSVDEITAIILEELEATGVGFPLAEQLIRDLIDRYFGVLLTFCTSWQSFRNNGGDPCG